MDTQKVVEFYSADGVVDHYLKATANIGLWNSEARIFESYLPFNEPLLELGTGTGRIAFALEDRGYGPLTAIDLAPAMIREATRIASIKHSRVRFEEGNATALGFPDACFGGALFGFNGLMQIPRRANRRRALTEILRVLQPAAPFIFTTHDRHNPRHRAYWKAEKKLWAEGLQKPELDEFGDRYEETPLGRLFIHIPTSEEVREDLTAVGFVCSMDQLRAEIAIESYATREFSDECRFWVAHKPG